MTIKDILTIAASIIVSVGGVGAIIFGFSNWFGDLIANRLLDKYKYKHEKDLENLKKDYQKELEVTKTELEKSKHQFLKYSDEQFSFYNELWKIFWQIKKRTDTLWQTKEPDILPSFARLLNDGKEAVYENILVIDKQSSDKLLSLIKEFEEIKFKEYHLSDLSKSIVIANEPDKNASKSDEEILGEMFITANKIKVVVLQEDIVGKVLDDNKPLKESFDIEILTLADIFRSRMRGQ